MDSRVVFRHVGSLAMLLGWFMLIPATVSWLFTETDCAAFLMAMGISVSIGFLLTRARPKGGAMGLREGLAVVTFGWVLAAALAALPFVFSGSVSSYSSAYFEAMSGLTTTGASVIPDVEAMSHAVLFWRALLHWIGGMGIIVLFIAVLPGLGVGAYRLFKAEVPGPVPERLEPRMRDTARTLWTIYIGLTLLETLVLVIGGMPLFDAITHTFATVATGGFSTKASSVGHWSSPFLQMAIAFFTTVAGCNFSLFYRMIKGRPGALFEDDEFRSYIAIIMGATLLVSFDLVVHAAIAPTKALRDGVFQVTTIITTTGFSSANFDTWPPLSKAVLLLLMFIGGCTGSTAGSIKVARVVTAVRHALQEVHRVIHPRAVTVPRINNSVIRPEVLHNILAFIFIYMSIFAVAVLYMAWLGYDLVSAFSSVAATLGNVGPGLSLFGPLRSYAPVPTSGKWVLSACMLLGRLELFGVLAMLSPGFWRNQ